MATSETGMTALTSPVVGRRAILFVVDNIVWFVLAIALILFSMFIEDFFQFGIFMNIFRHATFVGLMAIGLAMVIISGHLDLSIESTLAFAAMAAAWLVATSGSGIGLPLPGLATLPVAVAIGLAVGWFNGFLVTRLHLSAFIVTLAAYIGVRGFGLVLSGGRSVYSLPDDFRWVAVASIGGVPVLGLIMVAAFLFFGFVLHYTRFGRYVYMVGGNSQALYRAGVSTKGVLTTVFVLSGLLAGIAGWLLAARTNGATANLGLGMLFEVFAAVVIGGVSLSGGVGRLSGVFAGVLLLSSIDTAINLIGLEPYYMQVIRGGLVLVAVLLDSLKTTLHKRYT
ncbi:MAG: ABC transporter permease [Azospirillaceae bacterium]